MTKSSARASKDGLDVFDWKEEDEAIGSRADRFAGRFTGNPKPKRGDDSSIDKYTFLQVFSDKTSGQRTEIRDTSFIDVDATSSNHTCNDHGSNSLGTPAAIAEVISVPEENPVSNCIGHREHGQTNPSTTDPKLLPGCSSVNSLANGIADPGITNSVVSEGLCLGVPSSGTNQVKCSIMDLQQDDPVDVISDDDEGVVHSSDVGEDQGSLEGSYFDHCSSGSEMDCIDEAVVLRPDYLVCGDKYSTESSISFYTNCIKVEGTNAYGRKESFSNEWGIDEVIGIVSLWHARVESAQIKLSIRPAANGGDENSDGNLGIVELRFAVCDPSWPESLERIMSTDVRYRVVSKVLLDTGKEADVFAGENNICSSMHYYPNFDEPFEEVIYPKGDPDAVSISKRDVELLQPETFINDTIIDFYIKYLKNKIEPKDRHRFHFFNSFFFRKLADMDKNPASASEGRAAFLRVRKWTRKVNLFEKDFVFIPVNFNLHWSLLVVCHPGEVASFSDHEIEKAPKVPCILHMDSIKGSHKGLKNLVQSYLCEEWRERHGELSEDISSKFFNLRFVPLEVPQQENSFDCGLFLLHFVELFLEEAPVNFSPFKITKFSNFLNIEWFPPAEASLKRAFIQKLIHELLEHESQESRPAASYDQSLACGPMKNNNENGHNMSFHLERQSPARAIHSYSSCSTAHQGIEIKLLTASSGGSQFARDSALVLRDLMEPGSASGSFTNELTLDQITPCHSFKVLPQIKEDESGEKFSFTSSEEAIPQSPNGLSANACGTSYAAKDLTIFEPNNSRVTIRQQEHYGGSSSVETSSVGSQNSSEERDDDHLSLRSFAFRNEEETKELRSASPENVGCITGSPASGSGDRLETCVVEDSQEVDRMVENDENIDSLSNCRGLFSVDSCNQIDSGENGNHESGPVQVSGDDFSLEAAEQRATKRLKLMPEAERPYTRSIAKDFQS